jgi:hypothetical protein
LNELVGHANVLDLVGKLAFEKLHQVLVPTHARLADPVLNGIDTFGLEGAILDR